MVFNFLNCLQLVTCRLLQVYEVAVAVGMLHMNETNLALKDNYID